MHIRFAVAAIASLATVTACAPAGVTQVRGAYEAPVSEGLAVGYATFDGRACPGTVEIDAVPEQAADGAAKKPFRLEANVTQGTVALAPRRMPAGRYRVTRVACRADAFADAPSVRYRKDTIERFTVRAGHIARVGVIDVRSPAPLARAERKRMSLAAIAAHTRNVTHAMRPFRAGELKGI